MPEPEPSKTKKTKRQRTYSFVGDWAKARYVALGTGLTDKDLSNPEQAVPCQDHYGTALGGL